MTVVKYKGKEIELCDELEPGYRELDILTKEDDYENDLEDTKEIMLNNLEDTQVLDIGEKNE